MEEIMVSVICNTYNHKDYIKDALESFLMQKTEFAFEILVHDDASTDGTPEIIREYEKKYPDIIKPIYQKENQYSQGIKINSTFQYPRAKGKYIALCEGDDYWTDIYKLQKQFAAMERNPDIDICAHKGDVVEANSKKKINETNPAKNNTILSVESVILGGGEYVLTNSLFFRKELNNKVFAFREFMSLDYTLQIQGSLRGGMLYLNDNMSAYRRFTKYSWTRRMLLNKQDNLKHYLKKQQMFQLLDKDTNYQYTNVIKKQIIKAQFIIWEIKEEYKKILSRKYKEFFKEYPLKARLKIRLKAYFPWLLKLKRKLSCK